MSKLKTDKFKAKVLQSVGEEYSVIGEYPLIDGKILMRHNECKHEWMVKPSKFLGEGNRRGTRCPKCRPHFGNKRLTEEEVQNRIDKVHGVGEYTLVAGSYNGYNKKAKVIHNCGYVWDVTPTCIITFEIKCPKCSGRDKIVKWSHKSYSKKIYDMTNGEYEVVSEFISTKKLVDIRHVKCGRIRTVTGNTALKGNYKCRACNAKKKSSNESKGERIIREYLEANGISFISQYSTDKCKYKRRLPFDFALIDENQEPWAMIEFDGEQHFNRDGFFCSEYTSEYDLELQQLKDGIKDRFCEENGIIMLRIPYTSINIIDSILNRFFRVYKKSLDIL